MTFITPNFDSSHVIKSLGQEWCLVHDDIPNAQPHPFDKYIVIDSSQGNLILCEKEDHIFQSGASTQHYIPMQLSTIKSIAFKALL
jgi:hypothetical protein